MCEPDNEDLVRAVMNTDKFYDDTTGEWLDPQLVREGCLEEVRRFKQMIVYARVPREGALSDPGMKLVGVRWPRSTRGPRRCRR